ncbi:MAG: ribonuclease J [Anaerolineales bacterium]|nr:ribonuclease J [Anaerolineales bacterium]
MSQTLRLIPIGGLGEIGKNMLYVEHGNDALIVDAGLMFPENDMLGIDYIIPDYRSLLDKKHLVRGIIITHGHEDHTGAIKHIANEFDAPLYATPLTRGLVEVKLRDAKMHADVTLNTIHAGDKINLGPFGIEFFHVCHSIPDGVGLGISTPAGLIVHSGDFKFDHTPVDGWPTDYSKLAEFAGRGVLALLSDSTNADQAGWTPSEAVIDPAFDAVLREAPGRVIIATFASLIARIQQAANAAARYDRKLALVGTSMIENSRIAQKLSYLDVPDGLIVPIDEALRMKPKQVVIMTTGTQGEPSSIVNRLAEGRNRQFDLHELDTVVFSSHPIPGNEEMVHRTINKLLQRGARVIYDPIAPVHVSGHASQEEQKLLIHLVKPKHFIPIHGELRHLHQHAANAREVGVSPDSIAVVENGTVIDFKDGEMHVGDRIPGGYVFVDGSGVGDIGPSVMREREALAENGVVVVDLRLNGSGALASTPELTTKGFVFVRDSEEMLGGARAQVQATVLKHTGAEPEVVKEKVSSALADYFYAETKRRPMIFTVVS